MNNVEVREVDGRNEPKDVLERIEEVLADWGLIPKKQFEKNTKSRRLTRVESDASNEDIASTLLKILEE